MIFGATCFLRLITPSSMIAPSRAGSPNARATASTSPATNSVVARATMSVTISAAITCPPSSRAASSSSRSSPARDSRSSPTTSTCPTTAVRSRSSS